MKRLGLLLVLLLLAPSASGGLHLTDNIDLQGEPVFLVVGPGGGVVAWRDGEQTGWGAYACENVIPASASRLKLGVR